MSARAERGYIEVVLIVILLALCIGFIVIMAIGSVEEQRQWEVFAVAKHCKVVGDIAPSVGTGVGITSNGKSGVVTTFDPGKTGYICDDGVTYWRSK